MMLLRTRNAGPFALTPPPVYEWISASALSSGRSTARAPPAASRPSRPPSNASRRRQRESAALVAATTTPLETGRAARAFANVADVLEVLVGQRVARQLHDRVGEALALVGLDPRLQRRNGRHRAAGEQHRAEQAGARERAQRRHFRSSRICFS